MRWFKLLLATLVVTLFTLPTGLAQSASAAAAATEKNCAVVIGKAPSAEADSPVISANCVDGTPKAPAETVLLARFYQHADYGGSYISLHGNAGPCDSVGYRFSDISYQNYAVGGISSYRVYSNCNQSKICNGLPGSNYSCWGSYRCWDVSYVGDLFNDSVVQIWLRNYLYCV